MKNSADMHSSDDSLELAKVAKRLPFDVAHVQNILPY